MISKLKKKVPTYFILQMEENRNRPKPNITRVLLQSVKEFWKAGNFYKIEKR